MVCGDETWLKLFPGLFMRHDGVSSFFVSIIPDMQRKMLGVVHATSCLYGTSVFWS